MSNHGLPDYGYTDFYDEVLLPYERAYGRPPTSVALPWNKYLPLYDSVISVPGPRFTPTILLHLRVAGGNIQVYPVTLTGAFLGITELLTVWYDRIGRVAGATELKLGPYTWPIPAASVGQPSRTYANVTWPTTIFGSWQQPPDNLTPPQATTTPLQAVNQEPPCRCESRALATTGHDAGCGYILWKKGRGVI